MEATEDMRVRGCSSQAACGSARVARGCRAGLGRVGVVVWHKDEAGNVRRKVEGST